MDLPVNHGMWVIGAAVPVDCRSVRDAPNHYPSRNANTKELPAYLCTAAITGEDHLQHVHMGETRPLSNRDLVRKQGLDQRVSFAAELTCSDANGDKACADPQAAVDCLAKGGWIWMSAIRATMPTAMTPTR